MKKSLISITFVTLGLFAGHAFAANADCEAKAGEKKLAGAAPAAAANPACEKSAADKKLAGAAKTSHIKKCMAEAGAKK